MRKVHYKVTLDIFVCENEDANVEDAIWDSDFTTTIAIDGDMDEFQVIDININSVKVSDSR